MCHTFYIWHILFKSNMICFCQHILLIDVSKQRWLSWNCSWIMTHWELLWDKYFSVIHASLLSICFALKILKHCSSSVYNWLVFINQIFKNSALQHMTWEPTMWNVYPYSITSISFSFFCFSRKQVIRVSQHSFIRGDIWKFVSNNNV